MSTLTREEKIAAICDATTNWDLGTLLSYIKDVRKNELEALSDEELDKVHYDECLEGLDVDEDMDAEDEDG
jgi:hypothetical protein